MKYIKILFYLSFFLSYHSTCTSQTQFQKTIGGPLGDFGSSIILTSDGGYAVAGYTESYGAGGYDLYIIKFSALGNLQWTKTYGGAATDNGLTIIQTSDGGYAVCGETLSFGSGKYDALVVKIDSSGTLQWSKTVGGSLDDFGESILQNNDGSFILAGYTNSYGAGDYDVYIAKLSQDGTLLWIKTIGDIYFDTALSLKKTFDGGYVMLGATNSFGVVFNDFFLVKTDSSGTVQWTRAIGGKSGDYGYCVIQTSDGGYAVSGTTLSYGAGNYDLYLVKFDSAGSFVWSSAVGGTDFDYGYAVIQTSDGGYAMTGSTASFGAGQQDVYILKFNSAGSLQWTKTAGGANDDITFSIVQTSDGGYIAAGYTYSFGAGNADVYLVKLDASGNSCGNSSFPPSLSGVGGKLTIPVPAPVSVVQNTSVFIPSLSAGSGGTAGFQCVIGIRPNSNELPELYQLYQNYPNPFNPSTVISYDLPQSEFVNLIVYDLLGREVITLVNKTQISGNYTIQWDASDNSSGIYFIKISAGEFVQTKKMLLIK